MMAWASCISNSAAFSLSQFPGAAVKRAEGAELVGELIIRADLPATAGASQSILAPALWVRQNLDGALDYECVKGFGHWAVVSFVVTGLGLLASSRILRNTEMSVRPSIPGKLSHGW